MEIGTQLKTVKVTSNIFAVHFIVYYNLAVILMEKSVKSLPCLLSTFVVILKNLFHQTKIHVIQAEQ